MQLARLEEAQRQAVDPDRFQPQIETLRERIASWDQRVERQRQRIAEGLEEQRQRMAEERAYRHEKERLRVVGQPPLDVADYFKDRQRDLQKLGQLLSEPTTRLVSVIGHGGMGKTALACKVLQDLERHRWPYTEDELPVDGVVYLSTRTAGISLERLFLDCAKLLGGEEQERLNAVWTNPQLETEEKIARLLGALRDGRYVILLDNLEDLLDDQGQLTDDDLRLFFEQGLMTSQGAQLMVTSRVALAFRREVMRFDRQVKLLEGLPVDDGVALLRELDPNGDYGLRDASKEQLAEAVELTHSVPRALEVLAGILANDPFATLGEVVETFYEQEDVVQALIEENYQRLDRDARRVIEALAVFRKPVPPLAVDYLLEPFAPGLDVPGVVQRLTRTNIVSVDRTAKTVTLHPIDQDYAYSQLPEEVETEADYTRQALERRAADYYVQLRMPEDTWESIDDLEPQLNEFEHRVRAGDYDQACQILEQISFKYLYIWGHYTRQVKLHSKLLERLADYELQMSNLRNLGHAYYGIGRIEESLHCFEQAVSLARDVSDLRMEGANLSGLGRIYRDLGDLKRAANLLEEALPIFRDIGDRQLEGVCLNRLGRVYLALGKIEQSFECEKESVVIARELESRRSIGIWSGHLSDVYFALGRYECVVELCKESKRILQKLGDSRYESIQLGRLGFAFGAMGQTKQAICFHKKALDIAREIGYRAGESHQLLGLGKALLVAGNLLKARRRCCKARELDIPASSYIAVLVLGITLLQLGESAAETFQDAASRCWFMLNKTANSYKPRYTLATALVGQAICDPRWEDESERPDLLAPALEEYRRALDITAAPGVVQDAIRDLELIQAAGIEGLDPVFELLESAKYEPDLPEELPDILEDFLEEDRE
jgi:tetratricopeptide (TPR) repeat protein